MNGHSDEAPVTNGDDNDYVTGSVYKNRTESDLLLSSSSLKSVFGSPQLWTNVLCVCVKDFRAFSNALHSNEGAPMTGCLSQVRTTRCQVGS